MAPSSIHHSARHVGDAVDAAITESFLDLVDVRVGEHCRSGFGEHAGHERRHDPVSLGGVVVDPQGGEDRHAERIRAAGGSDGTTDVGGPGALGEHNTISGTPGERQRLRAADAGEYRWRVCGRCVE